MDTLNEPRREHADLAKELRSRGVEYAFGAWVDVGGRAKGKMVPIELLPSMLAGSERYTPRGMGNLGRMNPSEDECVAVPDPSTVRVLPWDERVAFFNADLLYGGTQAFSNCPRSILKSVVAKAAGLGYRFMLGVETEFYVFRRDALPELVPLAPSSSLAPTPAYDVASTLDSFDFLAELGHLMAASELGLFSMDHEGGNGQYELDFAHREAVDACDALVYLRLMLRHVAQRHGGLVTFMPKPAATAWGSGAHMNMSLERFGDGHENAFITVENGSRRWQPEALHFVGGLLKHASALSALTCPTVNSYKRLRSKLADGSVSWAPVWATYGLNNRSCLLRLPANRPAVENRGVDMAANMYLASAFTLAAGLEGIEQQIDPGSPEVTDTSQWDIETASAPPLPRNLLEAIEAFEADPLVHAIFPKPFVSDYVDMKRDEWDAYHRQVSQWEIDTYLENL